MTRILPAYRAQSAVVTWWRLLRKRDVGTGRRKVTVPPSPEAIAQARWVRQYIREQYGPWQEHGT